MVDKEFEKMLVDELNLSKIYTKKKHWKDEED